MLQQLKLYFPQVLEWFDDLTAPIVAAFLRRWPTLAELQKEAPETIRTFFHEQGSRSAARINQRLQQMQRAKAPVSDAAVIDPGVLAVETALAVVAVLNDGIRKLEKAIEEVSTSQPEDAIFYSFPPPDP